MGIHSKKNDAFHGAVTDSTTTSFSLYSLSFSAFLSSKDRQPNFSPANQQTHERCQVFEFRPTSRYSIASDSAGVRRRPDLVRPKQSQPAGQAGSGADGRRSLSVRNNSIRRGGRVIREEDDESRSVWSVFRSFVSPCRECRASKPAVVQPHSVLSQK